MKNYIIMRLLATVPLLLGISFLCFVFINLIPSDPAEVALRIRQTPIITEELIAQTRAELGLDQPFLVRYAHWLWDCLHFDLGVSYTNPARTVLGEIGRCLPATLELAGLSLVYVIVLSLPIGFLSAVYKDTWFDRIMRGVVFATTAMPVYWVGLLLIWIVSIKLDLLPTSGYGGFSSLILPAFTVALSYISTYIRLIRASAREKSRPGGGIFWALGNCTICKRITKAGRSPLFFMPGGKRSLGMSPDLARPFSSCVGRRGQPHAATTGFYSSMWPAPGRPGLPSEPGTVRAKGSPGGAGCAG